MPVILFALCTVAYNSTTYSGTTGEMPGNRLRHRICLFDKSTIYGIYFKSEICWNLSGKQRRRRGEFIMVQARKDSGLSPERVEQIKAAQQRHMVIDPGCEKLTPEEFINWHPVGCISWEERARRMKGHAQ